MMFAINHLLLGFVSVILSLVLCRSNDGIQISRTNLSMTASDCNDSDVTAE